MNHLEKAKNKAGRMVGFGIPDNIQDQVIAHALIAIAEETYTAGKSVDASIRILTRSVNKIAEQLERMNDRKVTIAGQVHPVMGNIKVTVNQEDK